MRRFAFRLALQIGEWDVESMMENMSASLMLEWMAFAQIEPFGSFEDELHNTQTLAMIANTSRDEEKKPNPFKATDFMRETFTDDFEKEDISEKMSRIFSSFGAEKLPGT